MFQPRLWPPGVGLSALPPLPRIDDTVAMEARTALALLPLAVLALGFVAYCIVDIARSEVRYLPKWAWILISILSIPLGGLVYLVIGRQPR